MTDPTPETAPPDAPETPADDHTAATDIEQLRDNLATAEAQRDELASRLTETQNRTTLERLLTRAGAVDTETASLLIAQSLDLTEPQEPEDLDQAVQQLLLTKPFLHRPAPAAMPSVTQSPREADEPSLASAARRAATTGHRKDIADYLRLRRQLAQEPRL